MNIHKEIKFEDDICEHLAANGWLYTEKDAADYDYQLALFPANVLTWVQETQPDAWEVFTKNHGQAASQTLLNRLRDSLNQSGTLHVLRQGFDVLSVRSKVKMAQFKPALAMNPDIMQRYAANCLRIVRQVHYSVHDRNLSIDLVLFLNGIPVATAKLKTDFTQSIHDAVDQYRFDRIPKPKGEASEPLLTFPGGALVHFAVSSSEVKMTTRLAGPKSLREQRDHGQASGVRDAGHAGGQQHERAIRQFARPEKRTGERDYQRPGRLHGNEQSSTGFRRNPGWFEGYPAGASGIVREAESLGLTCPIEAGGDGLQVGVTRALALTNATHHITSHSDSSGR